MDSRSRFWDRIAERYARKPVPDEGIYQRKLAMTREYLREDMDVLEIGCGTGATAVAHAPYVRHVRAMDISPKMIEIARGRAAEAGVVNVDFECAQVDTIDVRAGALDAVLGLSILHLLEDRDAVIRQVHAALKPGGVFVSSTACLGDSMKFFKWIGPLGRWLGLLPLVRVFSRGELRRSLESAGFEIDREWMPGKGLAVFMVARKAMAS